MLIDDNGLPFGDLVPFLGGYPEDCVQVAIFCLVYMLLQRVPILILNQFSKGRIRVEIKLVGLYFDTLLKRLVELFDTFV